MATPTRHRLSDRQLQVWTRFLQAHSAISRELERDLVGEHGLTLSDYDVLVQLAKAPQRRLRPVELSRAVLLTRGGVTRLVQGLERAGLVDRIDCPHDRRGSYVRLTDEGRERLRRAARTHLRGVRELFATRFGEQELDTLGALLERMSGGRDLRD
jgi:DNA-binding MarR family transcriptional regulator